MNKRKYRNKKYKFTYIKVTLLTLFICSLFVKGYTPFEPTGDNFFHVRINGQDVGSVASPERAETLYREARKNVALAREGLTFVEAEMTIEGEELLWGKLDREKNVQQKMEEIVSLSTIETLQRAYTLKYNDKLVNLNSLSDVKELLQAAINRYDTEGQFCVDLVNDTDKEFRVFDVEVEKNANLKTKVTTDCSKGGVATYLEQLMNEDEAADEDDFDSYERGTLSMDFKEKMEVVEAYLPLDRVSQLQTAMEEILKETESVQVYTVQSGDTLSEIAINLNIPMDRIIEMNDSLEDERTTLRIGQELITTVPEQVLSVVRVEQNYYEEIYDEEVVVIDVPEWYTNQTEVVQQPSAGFRKIIADVTYENDKVVSKEILKEEVLMEAVAKVIKRGTKIPPTYIKPISGGRLSSKFGPRKAPKKGASTYHKGVDWAIPTGSAVYASCGGTVSKAGWGNGYGYVVYIDHVDGKQTRYGHLSKPLVKVGQKVKQGDKIALSGNTGVSSGPHLHFEILVNGVKVDPFKYLK